MKAGSQYDQKAQQQNVNKLRRAEKALTLKY
jgi:hypothetical protein